MRVSLTAVVMMWLAIAVAACSAGGPALPGATPGAAASADASTSAMPLVSGEASADPGIVEAGDQVVGTITYSTAAAGAASADYKPGGGPVTLSATDSAGATWTLTIPDGATPYPTTFRMTPLATVDAKLPGPAAGGVLLEPEGTVFTVPVNLTVTGGTGGSGILQGDADGNVRIAMPAAGGWGTATLEHFSPVLTFIPDDAVWLPSVRAMAEATGKAYAAAQELLKTKIGDIPTAPSIPYECRDDDAWAKAGKKIDAFINDFFKPEGPLLQQLLAGKRMAELVGLNYDKDYTVERKLLDRLSLKAGMLLDKTRGQSDRVMPVLDVTYRVAKSMALLGSDPGALLAKIGPWAEASLDPIVQAIRDDHDYAKAAVAFEIGRLVELYQGKGMADTVIAKLEPVLRFKATLRLTLKFPKEPAEKVVTGGAITLDYKASPTGPVLFGEGLIDYESYHHDQGLTLEAPSFQVQTALVDLEFCAGTANLLVDQMGGKDEVRVDSNGHRIPFDWIRYSFEVAYDQYGRWDNSRDMQVFAFPVAIRNGKVTMVDETFDFEKGGDTASFEVTVEHTPGG